MVQAKWFSKKVVLLGPPAAGKTSLINRFVHHKFSEEYASTIGLNIVKKSMNIDGVILDLILWEVAGQEKMWQNYLKGSEGIIYVTDISDFQKNSGLANQIESIAQMAPDVGITIVGNKADLLSEQQLNTVKESLSLQPHFYTSAKTGENVDAFFLHVGKQLLAKHI